MSPKSLIHHTFPTLLDLFRDSRDVVAAIIRPIGPLIRIYHHDFVNALLGFPPRSCDTDVGPPADTPLSPPRGRIPAADAPPGMPIPVAAQYGTRIAVL